MKVDAMIISDLHIMDKQPKCRTDNFIEIQIEKFKWLNDLWIQHKRPILLIAGDVFDRWNASHLCMYISSFLPTEKMFTIYGNHDLKAHNSELLNQTAYGTFSKFYNCDISLKEFIGFKFPIYGYGYGSNYEEIFIDDSYDFKIAMCHEFTYNNEKPFPGELTSAKQMCDKLKDFDLIITGDNHHTFTYSNKRGQLLINPGAFTRHNANLIDHKPAVFLWNAENNDLKIEYAPINEKAMTREYIEVENVRNEKLEEFASQLSDDIDTNIDYKHNLLSYIKENNISNDINDELMEALNE